MTDTIQDLSQAMREGGFPPFAARYTLATLKQEALRHAVSTRAYREVDGSFKLMRMIRPNPSSSEFTRPGRDTLKDRANIVFARFGLEILLDAPTKDVHYVSATRVLKILASGDLTAKRTLLCIPDAPDAGSLTDEVKAELLHFVSCGGGVLMMQQEARESDRMSYHPFDTALYHSSTFQMART